MIKNAILGGNWTKVQNPAANGKLRDYMKVLLVEPNNAGKNSLFVPVSNAAHLSDKISEYDEILPYAKTGDYDVIVLNTVFVTMDYLNVIIRLRKNGIHTPIFYVSASSTVEARVMAINNGADDALSSPFAQEEFTARLRSLARRRAVFIGDKFSVGDIWFDRRLRTIEKDGKQEKLRGKEFALMEIFAINPNQVIPKNKFTDKIWGYDSDAEYNNVEVYVSFLRKKLRSLDSKLKIVSVRDVGYYLDRKEVDDFDEWYYM